MLQRCTRSYISTAWQHGTETFKALKAFFCLSWFPTEKACSQSTPVNVVGLSLSGGCAVIAGKVPLHVTTHFHARPLYLQWIIDLWDRSCSPFPCQCRTVPSRILNPSRFSWETMIQTDQSFLYTPCILRTALKTGKHSRALVRKWYFSWVHQEIFSPPHRCSLMTLKLPSKVAEGGMALGFETTTISSGLISRTDLLWTRRERWESIPSEPQGVQEACVSVLPQLTLLHVWSPQRAKTKAKTFLHLHTQHKPAPPHSHFYQNICLHIFVHANSRRPSLPCDKNLLCGPDSDILWHQQKSLT